MFNFILPQILCVGVTITPVYNEDSVMATVLDLVSK